MPRDSYTVERDYVIVEHEGHVMHMPTEWGVPIPKPIKDYTVRYTTPMPPLLEELIAVTNEQLGPAAVCICGVEEGTLLQMLVASIGARRVLDIGTFTGFSALMMAAALPDDGRVIACEVNPNFLAVARRFIARSPHGHKIEIREGPALETLKTVQGPIDFASIDADKENYIGYYEALVPMLAPNGMIAVDNVLWSGHVAYPEKYEGNDFMPGGTRIMATFNERVQQDPRVKNVILTVRDGVMLIRRA